MAFAWDTITQYVTEIKTASMQEVRDNADSVAVTLETSLTWSEGIVQNVDKVDHDGFQEIQDNIDFLVTKNVCSTHNATKYTTHLDDHHATHNSTQKSGDDATDNSGHQATHDSTHLNSDLTTHMATHDSGHNTTHNSGDYDTHYLWNYSAQHITADYNLWGCYGHHSTNESVYMTFDYMGFDRTDDICPSHYSFQHTGYRVSPY